MGREVGEGSRVRITPAISIVVWFGIAGASSGQERIALMDSRMPANPPVQEFSLVDAFPGIGFSQPVALRTPPGETKRLFVVEKTGDVRVISDIGAPTNRLFLDVDGLVNARAEETFETASEQGLLSMAFHPEYAGNGRFFVVYNAKDGGTRVQRLSEFRVSGNADVADAASEKVILQMKNEAGNHNGGDLHFGPDGYLYMSWGDEGGANDTYNNSQKIDKDFWSSITRIDIDLEATDYTEEDGGPEDDGNLRPNPHEAIVSDPNGNPRYEVPADNPWVGATSFLGSVVSPTMVRTEFHAVGLRNPWRFSFDPVTGKLWCGDVGQGAREEVDVIVKGGNYEWGFREGFIEAPGAKWNQRPAGWTGSHPPLVDYGRGSGAMQGTSITGGIVYRGTRIPGLSGNYIFADYGSGNVWSLDVLADPPVMTRICGEGGLVGFGSDPNNLDILAADIQGRIMRLASNDAGGGQFPQTLTATGLFKDVAGLVPSPGLVAYDVNLPFWSDHAIKRRWFGIPDDNAMIGFNREGNWTLPQGMVWVKHFDMEMERGNPASKRRIETRVIVRNPSGNYGVSYRWNEAGTEAILAAGEGEGFDLPIIQSGGGSVTQRWRIPSRSECGICHTVAAGNALSFRTRQLNRAGEITGVPGNFIKLLEEALYLKYLDEAPALLPKHLAPSQVEFVREDRVRSYLDVNCAYCHNAEGSVPVQWDARAAIPLFESGMVDGELSGGAVHPADRLLVPGLDQRSAIVHRMAERAGYTRMPPIGSELIDWEGVMLLTEWINEDLPGRESYGEWSSANFVGNSTDGGPGVDFDGDGRTNYDEFVSGTNPRKADVMAGFEAGFRGDGFEVLLPKMEGRASFLEVSQDLKQWKLWEAEGNDGLGRAGGAPLKFTLPIEDDSGFIRMRMEEK